MGADRYHTCRRQVGWGPWPTSKGAVSHPPANGCRGWPEFLIEGGKADLNADFLKLRITVRVRPSKSMGCARPLKILENRKKKKKVKITTKLPQQPELAFWCLNPVV